jgi:hypothetical protein
MSNVIDFQSAMNSDREEAETALVIELAEGFLKLSGGLNAGIVAAALSAAFGSLLDAAPDQSKRAGMIADMHTLIQIAGAPSPEDCEAITGGLQ